MSKRIKISPKYGVNPTIPVCFFCGEEKNEIALLGRIGDGRKHEDLEAPRKAILDYEPCDKCKEKWSKGVTIVEVTPTQPQDGRPPIQKHLYPTGRAVVITPEAWSDLTGTKWNAGQSCLIEDKAFDSLFGSML